MKELVFFDLDNTLIRGQSQIHFVSYLYQRGMIGRVFYLRLIFWAIAYRAGLNRDPRLIMKRAVTLLRGRKITEVESIVQGFVDKVFAKLFYREALAVVQEHQNLGREVILISNAIAPIASAAARRLNVTYALGTNLGVNGAKFTGTLEREITYGAAKAQRVKELASAEGFSLEGSWAYCDHISDLPLLDLVTYPVAVNPDRKLRREAERRNWPILVFEK